MDMIILQKDREMDMVNPVSTPPPPTNFIGQGIIVCFMYVCYTIYLLNYDE